MSSLVNKIGIGAVQFGLDYGISNKNGKTEMSEVVNILNYASLKGIEIIDTAKSYGDAESVLGECNASGKFKIVSKFMPSKSNGSITDQFNDSCEKIKTNQLYAYLAHRPYNLIENKRDWSDLNELKKQRKVLKIGYSLNEPFELEALLQNNMLPDIIQVPYSYFDNRFEPLMIELKKNGVEIHTRSAFLQGLFFMNTEHLSSFFDALKPTVKHLQETCGNNLSKMLLSYVITQPFIDKAIIGVENQIQLQNNIVNIESVEKLPKINIKVADKILMPSNWQSNR